MNATIEAARSVKRILIIDDEIHVREVVQTCLETLGGWRVLSATSVREGLIKAELEQPDAILLDMMLPKIKGLALLRQLQASPVTQNIPVVLLTAMAYQYDQQQLPELGVRAAIAKPFTSALLANQIRQALGW